MDVPGDGERVALAYGVNDQGTFIPASAAKRSNVSIGIGLIDNGAPVGARDLDLVYLIEAVGVWSGPVSIVWKND